jgi:hypothetical protein
MSALALAISFQLLAVTFFLFWVFNFGNTDTKAIKAGQCWEHIIVMRPRYKDLVYFRYVKEIKDGYVQFEERQCVEPESGSVRVESLKDFKDRGALIETEPNPFEEPKSP